LNQAEDWKEKHFSELSVNKIIGISRLNLNNVIILKIKLNQILVQIKIYVKYTLSQNNQSLFTLSIIHD